MNVIVVVLCLYSVGITVYVFQSYLLCIVLPFRIAKSCCFLCKGCCERCRLQSTLHDPLVEGALNSET